MDLENITIKHNLNNSQMKRNFSETPVWQTPSPLQEIREDGSPPQYCIIFIEDYDIYQYFDGNKPIFLNNNPYKKGNIKVAVISKNIYVSNISKNTAALAGNKPLKKSAALKYINKYYKNESYFFFECGNGEYGIYHTLPANTKKYYSLGIVDFVIPYEYLVILFLKNKLASAEQTPLLFIEETDKIYKVVAAVNGFNLFQVISFKEDMLNENLNFLQTELNSKKIKINKIFTNSNSVKAVLNGFYSGAEIINFDIKEFFEFFNNLESAVPHFENLEVKFKKLAYKKNRLNNLFIASLLICLIVIISGIAILNGNVLRKREKIVYLNNKIAILNDKIAARKAKLSINKMLAVPDVVKYFKKLILILPKDTRIKNLIIIKSGSHYIFYGNGFVRGGYKKFVKNYNKISADSSSFKMFHMTYNIDKFNKPSFKFHGVIR